MAAHQLHIETKDRETVKGIKHCVPETKGNLRRQKGREYAQSVDDRRQRGHVNI